MVKKIKNKTKNKNTKSKLKNFSLEVFSLIKDNSFITSRLKIMDPEAVETFYTVADLNPSVAVHIDRIVQQNINLDTNSLRFGSWLLTQQELELMVMFQILPDGAEVKINEQYVPEDDIITPSAPKIEIVKG